MKKVYVGNLPPDVRTRDVKDLFDKYGPIADIDLKNSRGPPFAFIEYEDERDAEDAVRGRDGYNLDGYTIRVEFPRSGDNHRRGGGGAGFGGRGGGRGGAPSRRGEFRVMVTGMPSSGSWQDLKDHMREVGDVGFADVRNGVGYVEFLRHEDMKAAIKRLDDSKFRTHQGETGYIRVKEERAGSRGGGARGARSRSPRSRSPRSRSPRSRSPRSRSPRSRSPPPRRRGSPSYSPMASKNGRFGGRSPSRSRSRSRT